MSIIDPDNGPRSPSGRPLRVDAARNRALVLDAALDAFAELGIGASLDEIARRAGVGPGTVHRHFPTKEALYGAVILANHASMAARAADLAAELPAGDAFYTFFTETVDRGIVNLALGDELAVADVDLGPAGVRAAATFLAMIDKLLRAAQGSNDVRNDIDAVDVRAMLVAVISATTSMKLDGPARNRMIHVVTDGMRLPARPSSG